MLWSQIRQASISLKQLYNCDQLWQPEAKLHGHLSVLWLQKTSIYGFLDVKKCESCDHQKASHIDLLLVMDIKLWNYGYKNAMYKFWDV